jgi:hypothetical protein
VHFCLTTYKYIPEHLRQLILGQDLNKATE